MSYVRVEKEEYNPYEMNVYINTWRIKNIPGDFNAEKLVGPIDDGIPCLYMNVEYEYV